MKNPSVFVIAVPGEPQGKGRPKVGRFKSRGGEFRPVLRTPVKTINYEARIALAWEQSYPRQPLLAGPVEIEVLAVYSLPPSRASKIRGAINRLSRLTKKGGIDARDDSHRKAVQAILLLSSKVSKPDWDNIGKVVCDALNGVAWLDDSQVVDARVRKRFAEGDEVPHLRVIIRQSAS